MEKPQEQANVPTEVRTKPLSAPTVLYRTALALHSHSLRLRQLHLFPPAVHGPRTPKLDKHSTLHYTLSYATGPHQEAHTAWNSHSSNPTATPSSFYLFLLLLGEAYIMGCTLDVNSEDNFVQTVLASILIWALRTEIQFLRNSAFNHSANSCDSCHSLLSAKITGIQRFTSNRMLHLISTSVPRKRRGWTQSIPSYKSYRITRAC